MTKWFLPWAYAAAVLGLGCPGHSMGPSGDGGDVDAAVVSDSGVVLSSPLVVAGFEQGGEQLQGGAHQLIWTGTQYAILYLENLNGHVFIRVRFIDAQGSSVSEAFAVTEDYVDIEDAPHSAKMVWVDGELRIFWTTRRETILMRRMGANGQLLSSPTPTVDNVGTHAYLQKVVPRVDEFALLWIDDRSLEFAYLPYFVRVDSTGLELFPQALMVTDLERMDTVRGLVEHQDQFSMVWTLRDIAEPDLVHLSVFDQDGVLAGPPQEIYRADDALIAFYGTPVVSWLDGALVAVWDMERGAVLVDTTDGAGEAGHLIAGAQDVTAPPVVSVSGSGSADAIAVLYGSGEYRDSNPLPTELKFAAVAPQDWNVGHRVQLNAQTRTPDSCLEHYDVVSSGGEFAVTWVHGCVGSGPTLYFTKVMPAVAGFFGEAR